MLSRCVSSQKMHVKRLEVVYDEFLKSFSQNPEGWYKTNLLWKEKHRSLYTSKSGSRDRLNSLKEFFETNVIF